MNSNRKPFLLMNFRQNFEFDVTIVVLRDVASSTSSSSSSSSRRRLFPNSNATTIGFTRAKKSIFVIGRQPEMESTEEGRNIFSFAAGQQFDDDGRSGGVG